VAGLKTAAAALPFWVAVALIQKFNWDLGLWKGLVLLAVLAALPFVTATAQRRRLDDGRPPRALAIAGLALLVLQTGYALKELRHPSPIDAATTTLAAGDLLRRGEDPYAARIDASGEVQAGDARYSGYKYLPLTIAAYLPLGAPLGERGVVLTNLLLHLAVVWLIFRLAADMAGASAGWMAVCLYLSLPLVPFQLFAKGVTDLAAVLPVIAALLLVERNAALTGLCVGLSLAAKPLPGALLLPCCLPAERRARLAYALGVGVGLIPVLPFLIWHPQAFIDNVVVFTLVRPADSTSWLFFAPPVAAVLAPAALAGAYLAALVHAWRRPPALARRCGLAAMLIVAAILAGPAAHHNYQLWWLPPMAALLGAALMPNTSKAPVFPVSPRRFG